MDLFLKQVISTIIIVVLMLTVISPATAVAQVQPSSDQEPNGGSVTDSLDQASTLAHSTDVISNGSGYNAINGSGGNTPGVNLSTTTFSDSDADRLPDYYEINVTGTDPMTVDSDSTLTDLNESGNGVADGREDLDHDLISSFGEYQIGTDPMNPDTDGDGLTDANEYYIIGTSPLLDDSDRNGVRDPDEDADEDGLTNLREQALGTNPKNDDSDWDSIGDLAEVDQYHTSPLNSDTDADGLDDSVEIALGSDQLMIDSDGDGLADGDDSFSQQFSDDLLHASVRILGSGHLQQTLKIRKNSYPYAPLVRLTGVASDFININTTSSFESATIRLYYDEARLNGSSEESLKLYYFDEATNTPIAASGQTLDTEENYVEATDNRLGLWFIADDTEWVTELTGPTEQKIRILNEGTRGGMLTTDSMSYAALESSDPALTFELGDTINILARVHNAGDADVEQDVSVSFYEGDPADDGILIGSSTIPGGIPHNSSKIAVMQGYVINSSSVDIYVQVDQEDVIRESSEMNNKAFKALSLGPQDSDGDGLSDTEEIFGMSVQEPYGVVYSDPYLNDTDEDGLDDNVEMGEKTYDAQGIPRYQMVSYPDNPDSDEDGLTDLEEVTEVQTLYLADSHERALNFLEAISTGADPLPTLSVTNVTTSPLDGDCDDDSISDGDEVLNGTNPQAADSDGDFILDGEEAFYGEDPTIFDIDSPEVKGEVSIWKPSGTADAQYNFMFTVYDQGGIHDIRVLKNGGEKYSLSNNDRSTAIGVSGGFTTPWYETLLDEFGTTRVDVYASDWNSNSNTTLIYHRPSMFGQWAAVLSSLTSDQGEIAGDMGLLAGSYACLAEIPESAVQLCQNPLVFVDGISTVVDVLSSLDPVLMGQLIDSVAVSYEERQELENPYTDPVLHDRFRTGWFSGYIATTLISFVAGGEVFKTITSSAEFAGIIGSVTSKLDSLAPLLKVTGKLRMTEKVGAILVKTVSVIDDPAMLAKTISGVSTGVKKAIVKKVYGQIGFATRPDLKQAVTGNEKEFGELIGAMPGDAAHIVSLLEDTDADTFQKMFSIKRVNGVTNNKLYGKEDHQYVKFRVNLEHFHGDDTIKYWIPGYLDNIIEISDLPKSGKFIEDVDINAANFKGLVFESKMAVYHMRKPGASVEIGPAEDILDLKVKNGNVVREIEQKASTVPLTSNKIKENLDKGQNKFSKATVLQDIQTEELAGNTVIRRLELGALEGTSIGKNEIPSVINDHMTSKYVNQQLPVNLDEIEVFFSDGTSLKGTWDTQLKLYLFTDNVWDMP